MVGGTRRHKLPLVGHVLLSDWPVHFKNPLLDPKGPRNAKKPDLFNTKNGAPPNFVLYTVIHYYGTSKIEFWQYIIKVIAIGLEFSIGLLPYV